MKVLAVIDTLGLGGGAERLLVSLVPELARLGVRVDVLSLTEVPNDLGHELEAQGFLVHRLRAASLWSAPHILANLAKILREGAYDATWGHLFFGNLYASLAGAITRTKPVVHTHHSPAYFDEGWRSHVLARVQKWVGPRLATRTVAVSETLANEYARLFAWQKPDVIHNGVCLRSLDHTDADRELAGVMRRKYVKADFTILIPARLVPAKGHVYLLQALELLEARHGWRPDVLLLGGGTERTSLGAQARTLGISDRVRILDPIPQLELFALMSVVNVVALPSLREPFGLAAAEAMALGCPTILTRVGGFMEIVGESQGAILVDSHSPAALADALWLVHTSAALMQTMSARGQRRIRERFDIHACAASWAEMFAKLDGAVVSGTDPIHASS